MLGLSCSMQALFSYGMWDLYLQYVGSSFLAKGVTKSHTLGVQSLSNWTTREVPSPYFFFFFLFFLFFFLFLFINQLLPHMETLMHNIHDS